MFFTVILGLSIFMALVYTPNKMKRKPFVISSQNDLCFASSETVCDSPQVTSFNFWNLTNPLEVISGTEPPRLKEIGPYVMHNAKEKKTNVTFFDNNTKVSYIATSYAEWKHDAFCDGCTLNDTIVSFNPAYYTLVHMFGSEKNFLYSLTPKVLPGVIGGIASVLKALGAMPSMAASLPHVKAAVEAGDDAVNALALVQWGDCSVLGGKSVTALPLPPATLAAFPVVPEFGAYAATAAGLNDTSILGLSPNAAKVIVNALTADPSGMAVLGYLRWPLPALAGKFNVTATQAKLIKGFIVHLSLSYGKAAGAAAMGPFLGPKSSGIFVKRSIDEWINGYFDPLTSSRYTPDDPRYLVRPVTKVFPNADLDPQTAVNRIPTAIADRREWPAYGATEWTLATGQDDPDRALDVLMSTQGAGTGTDYTYSSTVRQRKKIK